MRKCPAFAVILDYIQGTELVTELPGGAKGDRTPDLGIANAALSQLSYRPFHEGSDETSRPQKRRQLSPPLVKSGASP